MFPLSFSCTGVAMETDSRKLPLEDSVTICQSLENVLTKSYGPNALCCLATTATGKVLVTSRGATILQLLHVAHPVGAMVTRSVLTHHQSNGGGTKTFIFLLSEILKNINTEVFIDSCEFLETSVRNQVCDDIAFFCRNIIPDILPVLKKRVNLTSTKDFFELKTICLNIIWTSLQGRFNKLTITSIHEVLEDFLAPQFGSCPACWRTYLDHILDHFDSLVIEQPGRAVNESAVLEGFVCQREYHRLATPDVRPVLGAKFVLLLMDSDVMDDMAEIRCTNDDQLQKALTWKSKLYKRIVEILCDMGVNLVLSDRHIPDAFASLCKRSNIYVIHRMEAEDLSYLSLMCGIRSVMDVQDLRDPDVIGCAEMCRSINISGRQSVCLVGVGNCQELWGTSCQSKDCKLSGRLPMKHVLLCGPSAGICNQFSLCVSDALKCMRVAFQEVPLLDGLSLLPSLEEHSASSHTSDNSSAPSCSSKQGAVFSHYAGVKTVPGGGTWEVNLSMILRELSQGKYLALTPNQCKLCSIIAKSLLHIPIVLLKNSLAVNAGQLGYVDLLHASVGGNSSEGCAGSASERRGQLGIDGRRGTSALTDPRIIEPVGSKLSLLLNVLQLVSQLIKVDNIVNVTPLPVESGEKGDEKDSLWHIEVWAKLPTYFILMKIPLKIVPIGPSSALVQVGD